MRKLRLRGDRTEATSLRACMELLEGRRLLSLSAGADSALVATMSTASAAAVPLAVQPTVTGSNPANGATGVNRGVFIRLDVSLISGAGVDPNTLNTDNVALNRASDNQFVNTNLNSDAGGGVIVITPTAMLAA